MLDVRAAGRFVFVSNRTGLRTMAEDDTPEDRLEAALERIAKVLDAPDPVAVEVAERLDGIIANLRDALSK